MGIVSAREISGWAGRSLAPGGAVLADSLASIRLVPKTECGPEAVAIGGTHANDLLQFRWMNTPLGKLKSSLHGMTHAFRFCKDSRRHLGCDCFRFNRRFLMAKLSERSANEVSCCMPSTEWGLSVAESDGASHVAMHSEIAALAPRQRLQRPAAIAAAAPQKLPGN